MADMGSCFGSALNLFLLILHQILNKKSEVKYFRIFDGGSTEHRLLLNADADTGLDFVKDLKPQSSSNHALIDTQVDVLRANQKLGDLWTVYWNINFSRNIFIFMYSFIFL